MREQDSSRHLSSLVKQDLAKLDNGDTRRAAIKSLQLLVEQLDSATLARFISLVDFLNFAEFKLIFCMRFPIRQPCRI